MKTIRNIHFAAPGLLLAMLLAFTQNVWAQPIVTVPSTCNVVVAGAGGTVGFGGNVGGGGIVVMPDPFAAGPFIINPMGNTILGWSLAGDLSFAGPTPPAAALQTFGPGLTSQIQSYNESVRSTESPGLARSKGRVYVSYTNPTATCGGGIQFDVFKKYVSPLPPIVGPDCIKINTEYTYSVDHIASDNYGDGIGGDEYEWTVPAGASISYLSADKSSVTFVTGPTLPANPTITCCFGKANVWGGPFTTCTTKSIGVQPLFPTFITPIPTCVLTSASSFTASINPIAGMVYTWAASNPSWTLTPSGSQGQNLAVTSIGSDPGIITLTVTYGTCIPSIFTIPVGRQFVAPIAISGSSCVVAGTVNLYSISLAAQNNQTCWTLPTGWTSTPANGTNSSINLTIPAGTVAGAYTISANSCPACTGGVLSYIVNVRPAVPVISGPNCVLRNGGSPVTYSTSAPGATSFVWGFPTGWSCLSGCTGASPLVLPGGTTSPTQNITVNAIGTNGCNSVSTPFVVNYSPVAPNSIAVNCWNFGIAGTTNITVANAPFPFYGTYNVTGSVPGWITSTTVNPTTGLITIGTSASTPAGTYTITITHTVTGTCTPSTTASTTFTVTYGGNGATLTLYPNPGPGNSDVYVVNSAPASPGYQWFLDATPVAGVTTNALLLSGSSTPPINVCVNVSSGGCITRLCTPAGTHSQMPVAPGDEHVGTGMLSDVKVFPNPNDGSFTLRIPSFKEVATVQILDASGKQVGSHTLRAGDNAISESGLETGNYFLILNMDGMNTVHKLQVSQK
jgi:hypothetical protein